MNKELAIIIPAYKSNFLEETLQSLSNQTCKNFTVYIGDDASPYNIRDIVEKYNKNLNIVYHRFDENKGAHNLIDQWNRCIDLSKDENWIWLFSDDDIMDSKCVELFYKFIEKDKTSTLLHFNTSIIDVNGNFYAKGETFPLKLSSCDFFEKRIKREILSFAVEYIFKRELYTNIGFKYFDLAWCSDDATWMTFAEKTGISTIDINLLVHWRYSGQNISSLNVDKTILYKKLNSKKKFYSWGINFLKQLNKYPKINLIDKIKWSLSDINHATNLSLGKRIQIAFKYAQNTKSFITGILGVLFIIYYETKHINKKRK